MIWLIVPLCLHAVVSQDPVDSQSFSHERLTDRSTEGVSGLYGYGVGLEVPMVGIQVGQGASSSFGSGYTLGAAVSWEFRPKLSIRVFGAGGEAFGSSVRIRYEEAQDIVKSQQDASWLGFEVGVGLTYLFRGILPTWVPYVGLDGGPHLHGYFYRFDETLDKLEGTGQESAVEGWSKNSVNLSYKFGLRVGVRMETLSWLASSLEVGFGLTRIRNANISGTIAARRVQGDPETLWTLRVVYSLFLGL